MTQALLLNEKTKQSTDALINSKAHGILISGEPGAGKSSLARYMIENILEIELQENITGVHIVLGDTSIGIDQIRSIQQFLLLRTTGTKQIRRAVLIENADVMTIEAQNAFLKILEEPPVDTVIIMTSSKPSRLMDTIHSRVQGVFVQPPSLEMTTNFLSKKGFTSAEIAKSHAVSNGQIGLTISLLTNADDPLTTQIQQAKQIYTMSLYERLALVDELSKKKETIPGLLYACKRICSSALEQAAKKDQEASMKSWTSRLQHVLTAEESLRSNPNSKLLLTDLLLNI